MSCLKKKGVKQILKVMVVGWISLSSELYVFAFPISPDITPADFDSYTLGGMSGVILGTMFWLLRIIGGLLIMYGIYRSFTAKKDGDANEINKGQLSLIFGLLFLAMPQILRGLKIII